MMEVVNDERCVLLVTPHAELSHLHAEGLYLEMVRLVSSLPSTTEFGADPGGETLDTQVGLLCLRIDLPVNVLH